MAWSKEDVRQIKWNLERKIKLLSLVKGMVIIASSHLFESELAQEFIEENPIVLEEGLLIPALISKYDSFSSFLGDKREKSKEKDLYLSPDKDEVNSLLSHCVDAVIKWDIHVTTAWFKDRLLLDIKDERSVLRYNLANVPFKTIEKVTHLLEELQNPSRGEIYKIAKNSGNKILWTRLSDYTDFIYYLSGARAVNSEGILPQENLIEFSITDLIKNKTKLSEYEIFYKIFVSIIKDKTQHFFPVEILDQLNFKDIVELRKTLLHSDFIEKYNRLMEKTKERIEIQDTERLILSIDELNQFEDELHLIFEETMVKELFFMKRIDLQKRGLKTLSSIAAILTFYGSFESVIQLVVNILSFLGLKKYFRQVESNVDKKLKLLKKFVDKSSLENKPIMLKYLSEISKRYYSKLISYENS